MKNFRVFPKKFGFIPYIFLVYLVMPLYQVNKEVGVKAVIGYVLLLLFFISYRQCYQPIHIKKFYTWLFIQVAVTVIFVVFYDPYSIFLGFYTSHFIGWIEDKKRFDIVLKLFASIVLLCAGWIWFHNGFSGFVALLPFIVVIILSPYGVRHMNERMELKSQLYEANEQIKTLIKQEERVRIARDLHDTLGHTLSLITLQSQVIQRIAEHPDKVRTEAKGIEQTSRSALQQVRELVADMRVSTIEEELVHIEQILMAANIEFHCSIPEVITELSPLQQNIAGLCLREASTNIVKHSKASKCLVTVQQDSIGLTIEVQDNGIGIADRPWGNGLKGMAERLSLIEGELNVSYLGGTMIEISIPIVVKTKERAVAL
ncbi:sensor histidine kinase [Sporosarcina thermotolerans]|uniref:histidine kinase n=1 Tax=Sporosarcina thermotolerans TaxID=633404 RepID=A0AAW9A9W0_9BACL|nr:sensor histidine kinase [Sporosarcina thermotolerans]MDW0117849.1 sensor histidine kinase [Sporosarcina thermotolerans]WHT49340.1 sensor histidine kinase [Sporosarcina thermotolerans]